MAIYGDSCLVQQKEVYIKFILIGLGGGSGGVLLRACLGGCWALGHIRIFGPILSSNNLVTKLSNFLAAVTFDPISILKRLSLTPRHGATCAAAPFLISLNHFLLRLTELNSIQ